MKPLIILTLLAFSGCKSDPCSLNAALTAVEQKIKASLRSPSSVAFIDVNRDAIVGDEASCKYHYSGEFDADNTYGASIRHTYEVSTSIDDATQKHIVEFKHITAR